jgi:glyoxylase-like metal-dependent hydrolase (beta-lactamase superfamily II)
VKIHTIQTGTVKVRTRQREGVGHGGRRRLNTLLDREWTDWLPINAYAIEHPEGVILVDTGETARAMEPGYFPRWHPYYRLSVRLRVNPAEEIGPQLEAIGIEPRAVNLVVLTHMHTDHAGGLHHFPGVEILASKEEIDAAVTSGFRGRVEGYPNNRFPSWLSPTPVAFASEPYGPFPTSARITEAGDVTIIPLPGHTPGHIGVVVDEGDHRVLLPGDASYTQDLMLRRAVDGVAPDDAVARLTLDRLNELVAERPTVYLPAHDPDAAARLADRQAVSVSRSGAGVGSAAGAGSASATS